MGAAVDSVVSKWEQKNAESGFTQRRRGVPLCPLAEA
jgi:hypothetical protein